MKRPWIWLLWKLPHNRRLRKFARSFGLSPRPGTESPRLFRDRLEWTLYMKQAR